MKYLVSLFFSLLLSVSVQAQTTIRVATWLPPSNPQNAVVWPTWIKWVEDATEGRVTVKLEYGMGHPKSLFALVEDGVVDMGFSVLGYIPGRFKLPLVAELPNISNSAEATSVALWRTQEKYFASAHEFDGLELLGMFVHGPSQIHTRNRFDTLEELSQMKIRIGGGLQGPIAERLGVTPVQAPAPKTYEMMQQGVVDGTFMPALEQKYSRLSEVSQQLTVIPKGLYASSFAFFANPEFMDSLDPRDRDAILSVSGEKLSALTGRAWETGDKEGYKTARAAGVKILQLREEDALTIAFRDRLAYLPEEWVISVADRNVDATQAMNYLKQQALSYEQQHAVNHVEQP